jgi:hypothetical protein
MINQVAVLSTISLKRSFTRMAVTKQFVLCSIFIFGPIGGKSNISPTTRQLEDIDDVVISCRIQVRPQLEV